MLLQLRGVVPWYQSGVRIFSSSKRTGTVLKIIPYVDTVATHHVFGSSVSVCCDTMTRHILHVINLSRIWGGLTRCDPLKLAAVFNGIGQQQQRAYHCTEASCSRRYRECFGYSSCIWILCQFVLYWMIRTQTRAQAKHEMKCSIKCCPAMSTTFLCRWYLSATSNVETGTCTRAQTRYREYRDYPSNVSIFRQFVLWYEDICACSA